MDKFDWNEWYTIILAIIVMSLFFCVRKHFRFPVILMIWIYSATYIATIDYALAASPFDIYYCGDNETYEPITAVAHLFMYTPFSFIFLYFYDKWSIRGKKLVWYLMAWAAFSIFVEWINIMTGFLSYKHWRLFYSIPTYPISALILIRVYHFVLKHLPEEQGKKQPAGS